MNILASLLCGLLFGVGLLVSGMTDPVRVLGFLDLLGRWDPTLAFVMAGALAVSCAGFAAARRLGGPLLAAQHLWPTRKDIDRPLIVGSILFGAGWGLVGLCPGPALENLASFSPPVILFVLAMIGGMAAQGWLQSRFATAGVNVEAASAHADG